MATVVNEVIDKGSQYTNHSTLTCVCILSDVPDSVVVGCQANDEYEVKPGELAIRLHFEAEHSNVLVVTAELLNGSLTTCEVLAMDMTLMAEKEKV